MAVDFAGNGKMDVGDGSMKNQNAGSLTPGGPVVHPKGFSPGMTAPEKIVNEEGEVPKGGGVTFTGGSDW